MSITEDAKKFVGAYPHTSSPVKYDYHFSIRCIRKYGEEAWVVEVDRISTSWHTHIEKFEAHSPTVKTRL